MADDNLIDQAEIERLLGEAAQGVAPAAKEQAAARKAAEPVPGEPNADRLGADVAAAGQRAELQAAAADATPTAVKATARPATSTDDDRLLGQDSIEQLLREAAKGAQAPPAPAKQSTAPTAAGESTMAQGDIEYLLRQAEQALASIEASAGGELPQGVTSFRLEEFAGAAPSSENATLDLIRDVELDLHIELGRTHMYLEDVLKLRKGSVVPLDKLAGDPVDIYVNGRLIARGEVLVLNDNFCVRVAELIAGTNVFA